MLSKKNRIVASLVSLGSVLALAGAGYAAWVIAGSNQTDDSKAASVEAYAVTDKRITLSVTPTNEGDDKIVFGKPSTTNNPDAWLLAEDTMDVEDLTFSFTATVTNAKHCSGVTATLTVDTANETAWNLAVTDKYVAAPARVTVGTRTEGSNGTVTYTLTGSFSWGDHFKSNGTNVNPYTFYNTHKSTDEYDSSTHATYGDDAKTALETIYKVNSTKFKLTVNATYSEDEVK